MQWKMQLLHCVAAVVAVGHTNGLPRLQSKFLGTTAIEQNCPVAPPFSDLPSSLPQSLSSVLQMMNATIADLVGTSVPGYSIEIRYNGVTILSTAAGIANTSSGLSWDVSTPSRVASVSKVLPAVLLHQLADLGGLTLDGLVSVDCPDFAVTDPFSDPSPDAQPSGAGVTWSHLASHMAGLQREATPGVANTSQALYYTAQTLMVAPAGQRPSYSNLGFAVLGHLLAECVAPKLGLPSDLPSLVQRLIAEPLGLANTMYIASADVPHSVMSRMAAGVTATGVIIPQVELFMGWAYPAGDAISSAADLTTLGSAILAAANGAITPLNLSAATARRLLEPVYRSSDGSYVQGMPWEGRPRGLNATAYPNGTYGLTGAAPWLVLNKGGNLPGYTALLSLVPSLNLSAAVLFNGGANEFGLSDQGMDMLLPVLAQVLTDLDPYPSGNPGPHGPGFYAGVYPCTITGGGMVQLAALGPTGPLLFAWADQATGQAESFYLDYFRSQPVPNGTHLSTLLGLGGPGSGVTSGLGSQTAAGQGKAVGAEATQAATAAITSLDVFRAFIPGPSSLPAGALPCLQDVTLGLRGQYVYVGIDENGQPALVAMPGFLPGLTFTPQA